MTTKNTVSLAIGLALGLGLAAAVGAWAQNGSTFGPGAMGGYGMMGMMMGGMGGPATPARYMATGPAGTNAMTEACLTTMYGNTGTAGKTTTGKAR